MQMIPRLVAFKNGVCVAAGTAANVAYEADHKEVMHLPTDHFDFLGYNPVGKTKEQISQDISDTR